MWAPSLMSCWQVTSRLPLLILTVNPTPASAIPRSRVRYRAVRRSGYRALNLRSSQIAEPEPPATQLSAAEPSSEVFLRCYLDGGGWLNVSWTRQFSGWSVG